MATLNGIAENIAFALGEQFNDTLKESIKDSVVDYRALLVRQDLDNNPLSYTDYIQSFCIDLEQVNKIECPQATTKEWVLRSKLPVPKPLRIKNNGRINFKYVGAIDRSISLTFEIGQALQYVETLPFQENVIYYTIQNRYLYVLNNLKLCKLVIDEVVADPREIKDCNNPNLFPDDVDFPIPIDMLSKIKEVIKREYGKPISDGGEVNIKKDDRN